MPQFSIRYKTERYPFFAVSDSIVGPAREDRQGRRLATNVQHELRTGLSIVIGYSELILDASVGPAAAEHPEWVEGIARGTDRLLSAVSAITDYLDLENGGPQLSPERLSLGCLVRREVERHRSAAEAKGLALSFHDAAPEAAILGDRKTLSRAVAEIVANAVKFTDCGRIHALLCRISGSLCVEVRDTGVGISEGFQPKLFQPFCQEDGAENRRFDGLGLGLALAKAMVESNGAKLTFKSERGWGSTFSIWFPRILEAATHPAAVRPADDRHPPSAAENGRAAEPRNGRCSPEA